MNKFKKFLALILIVIFIFSLAGCSNKGDEEILTLVSSQKTTSLSKVIKSEENAKERIRDYIYLNALPYTIYDNQSGKIDKSIKKDGFYYFAVFETVNGKNKMVEKFFAIEKKNSKIYAVDKDGKMISVFEDKVLGPKQ